MAEGRVGVTSGRGPEPRMQAQVETMPCEKTIPWSLPRGARAAHTWISAPEDHVGCPPSDYKRMKW